MSYIFNFFVSLDQLANTLAGGYPDNTISARVGYYTEKYYKPDEIPMKWKLFRFIINFTFYPVDGKGHCKDAYFKDAGEKFDEQTSDLAIAFLSIIIILVSVTVAPFLYLLYGLGIVSPKKIDRRKTIKNRLRLADAKLNGVLTELKMYDVESDSELKDILNDTQEIVDNIAKKIEDIKNKKV